MIDEAEACSGEVQPAEMRSPTDGGGGGETTQPDDAPDKKTEEKDSREHAQNTFHVANGLRLCCQSIEVNFELKGGKEQRLLVGEGERH